MSTPRVDFTLTLLAGGKVLAVGGRSGFQSGLLDSAELYDPAVGHWVPTGPLLAPREGAVATRLADGRVLLCGGDETDGSILASAELYDPVSGEWKTTGSMRNARVDFSASRLTSGKVLVAGGFGSEDLPTNVELYDPEKGIWSPTIPLITGREGHSLFRLADGQVVIVGGFNFDDLDRSASAELYNPTAAAAPVPIALTGPGKLADGEFRFDFNNTPGLNFEVLATPGLTMPAESWKEIGPAKEVFPGVYEFTDVDAVNSLQTFYRVRF
jgi:hypothetical protein